jgi:hypothetical protein
MKSNSLFKQELAKELERKKQLEREIQLQEAQVVLIRKKIKFINKCITCEFIKEGIKDSVPKKTS